MERYKIICNECQSDRVIEIHKTPIGQRIDWLETPELSDAPICSARLRFDGQWGFQCRCGNNNLWTTQESRVVVNKVAPRPQEIEEIMKDLEPSLETNFKMVQA